MKKRIESLKGTVRLSIARVSANPMAQALMGRLANNLQFYMGIGSGGTPDASGEGILFDLLLSRRSPPYCIIDAGANIGQFASLALRFLGEGSSTIHCFEPSQSAYSVLQEKLGTHDGVLASQLALGRENASRTLFYDRPGSTLASLTKRNLDFLGIEFSGSEQVRTESLGSYCNRLKIPSVDLLKIDVEGHELDVLAGAEELILGGKIAMVSFEFGGCNISTRTFFQDFYSFFSRTDMRLYRITPGSTLVPIDQYREELEQFRTTNFVALSRSLIGDPSA
ncbi:MAG: FkbM family methyltransferase [Myxococcales bacterium]|nr:FkbM family methyltransferase [Myxococcales bacterium]